MRKLTLLAAAAGVALYVGTQHPGTATVTSATAPSVSGDYSCTQLEHLWEAEGGSSSAAFMAAEIATAESAGDPNSKYDNTNGTEDRGLWQINSSWGSASTFDPAANARAAISISHNGTDWGPWVTFEQNKYEGQC